VEAHIFVGFLADGLHVTLQQRLRALAPGLTPRAVLESLAGVPRLGVEVPTRDGRWLVLSRSTQPDAAVSLVLGQLQLQLPGQPPPRLSAARKLTPGTASEKCREDLGPGPAEKTAEIPRSAPAKAASIESWAKLAQLGASH
jgi:hypothetical protein